MRVSFMYINYPNSRGASVLSALGGLLMMIGCPMVFLYGMGLVPVAVGIGMQILAKVVANNKSFKLWMKSLLEKGVLDQIPNNIVLAIKLYEANPCKKTLKYLQTANPQAAMIISQNKK